MLVFAGLLTCLMVTVIIADVTRYIIPNWLVGIVLVLYPFMVWLSPARPNWKMALIVMLIVFALGFLLFAIRAMGGGDVKLMTACALWVGQQLALEFFFMIAIIGGVMSILLWVSRIIIDKIRVPKPESLPLPRVLTRGAPVPYGVAIAIAFSILIWSNKIPGLVL